MQYAIGVASGTEALQLSLMALSVGSQDEVITAVNTAIPTAMAIVATGARPKFVDVEEDTFNIDPVRLGSAISKKTKAIIPVHLYGNPCNIEAILKIAKKHNLHVVEDASQAHGAAWSGKKVGGFGDLAAFSFYPTKNLGCYGDGGMVVTDTKRLADKIRCMRNYGQSTRYASVVEGINSRLDEVQAAVLRIKLRHISRWNRRRIEIAKEYERGLRGIEEIILPVKEKSAKHVFHLYVIRGKNRDKLKLYLKKRGIMTEIHYPIPLHLQKAFKYLGYKKGDFPSAEKVSREILSLPIFPNLMNKEIKRICNNIRYFYGKVTR